MIPEDITKAALRAFNGGIVRKPDADNPRGYTDYYAPIEAMEAAIRVFAPMVLELAAGKVTCCADCGDAILSMKKDFQ